MSLSASEAVLDDYIAELLTMVMILSVFFLDTYGSDHIWQPS